MKNKLRKKDLMKGLKKGLCLGLAGVMLATGSPIVFGENTKVEARELTDEEAVSIGKELKSELKNIESEWKSLNSIWKNQNYSPFGGFGDDINNAYTKFLNAITDISSLSEKTLGTQSYSNKFNSQYSAAKKILNETLKNNIKEKIDKYSNKDIAKVQKLRQIDTVRQSYLDKMVDLSGKASKALTKAETSYKNIKDLAEKVKAHIDFTRDGQIWVKNCKMYYVSGGNIQTKECNSLNALDLEVDKNTIVKVDEITLADGRDINSPVQFQFGQSGTWELGKATELAPVQTQTPVSNKTKVYVTAISSYGTYIKSADLLYLQNGAWITEKIGSDKNMNSYYSDPDVDSNTTMYLRNCVLSTGEVVNEFSYNVGTHTAEKWGLSLKDYEKKPTQAPVVTEQPTVAPVVTQLPVQTPAPKECIVNINVIQGADKSVKIQSAEVDYTKNGCTFAKYLKDSLGCSVYAEDGTVVEIYDIVLTNGTKLDKKVFRVNGDTNYDIDISAFATLAPTVAPTQAPVQTVAPTQAPVVITEPPVSNGPVFTEKPVYTQAPVYTQQPTYTQTPVNTYNPGNTTPVYTQAPVVTDNGNSVPGTIYTPNPVNPTFAPVNPGTVAPATSANPGTGAIAPGNGSTDGNVGPNSTQKPDVNPGNGNSSTVPGTVKTPTPQQTEEPDGEDMEVDANNKDIPDATVAELTCTKKEFKVGVGERFKLPVKGVGVTFKGDAHCSVDRYGYVKAKKEGKGTVIVTDGANTITVNVDVKKAPTKVKLKAKAFKVKVGKEAMIRPKFTSTCWSSKNKWKSSNKKIFTVENGKIKGIKKGTAKLTVITYNGKKATAKIIVYK